MIKHIYTVYYIEDISINKTFFNIMDENFIYLSLFINIISFMFKSLLITTKIL